MDKKVTVLTPNGRRQNVRVSGNTTLLEILETACEKHDLNSDEYCLKFHNKEVSLSQMFRFSGLPNNCLLEMEKIERKRVMSSVTVCFQIPDGTRNQSEFNPDTNLWHIVEQLFGQQSVSFESPVAIYMRTEIIGKQKMMETTLKSLGITEGRAMLRLVDKKPEELKKQANVYKLTEVKAAPRIDDDERPSTSRQAISSAGRGNSGGGFAITSNMVKNLKRAAPSDENDAEVNDNTQSTKDEPMDQEPVKYDWGTGAGYTMQTTNADEQNYLNNDNPEDADDVAPDVHIIGPRQAVLFSLDATQKQIDDLPDSFFDLTVNDLKLVLRDLKRTATGDENAPLLTTKLRELEQQKTMLNKLSQYKECVLRIQFPDRYVLQGIFKPHENLEHIVEFVRNFLQNPNVKFELFTIPPKKVIPFDQTLLELDFVPNAILHFAYEEDPPKKNENQSYIKTEFHDKLTSEEGAHYAVQKYRYKNNKKIVAMSVQS